VTISSELQRGEQLDQVGGIDYFYELGASVITSSVAYEYASIVKEKAVLRNILKTCNQVNADVYGNEPIANILEKIEKRIFDLTQIQMSTGLLHVKDILNRRMEEYMEIIDNPSKLDDMKVNSTYQELDNVLGGFKSGDLIIIAARPSMGKTAFVLNLMIRTAMRLKKAVSMFSLEMGAEQIVDRVISTVSGVPMHKITKGLMDANDFSAMGEAMSRISDTAMYVDDA
jgi:replicative DNA helicase